MSHTDSLFIAFFLILSISNLKAETTYDFANINYNGSNIIVTDSIRPIISREIIYHHIENRIDIYVPTATEIIVNGYGLNKIDNYGHYSITTYNKKSRPLYFEHSSYILKR